MSEVRRLVGACFEIFGSASTVHGVAVAHFHTSVPDANCTSASLRGFLSRPCHRSGHSPVDVVTTYVSWSVANIVLFLIRWSGVQTLGEYLSDSCYVIGPRPGDFGAGPKKPK